jgi:perosamine synthetase
MTKIYCGEMGRSPTQLLTDWIWGWGKSEIPQLSGHQLLFTQSGRSAILAVARLWNLGSKDEVLVPAYNCGSEISPLIATGARISMYRVDDRARIDIADLLRRVTPRTKMVHVTHYFGRPADLDDLVKFCRANNIKLLEDCALSLYSGTTGQQGDAAIFSFRKTLPAVSGGALLLRNSYETAIYLERRSSVFTTTHNALSLMRKWSKISFGLDQTFSRDSGTRLTIEPAASLPDLPVSYYCSSSAKVRRGSRLVSGLLRRTNSQAVVQQRRENYMYLRHRLAAIAGVTFLSEEEGLLEDVCPLGLPLLVDDKRRWCDGLNAAGIATSPLWMGCHRGLDWSQFPEALSLKARLILLPVDQSLDIRHMEFIANTVRSLAAGI